MKVIGLTGGIGMGKSTAAAAFRRAHIPVFDADAAVHKVQAKGGRAIRPIEAAFPGTIKNGEVDRTALRDAVIGNPEAIKRLEHILHPMVWEEEARFLAAARRRGDRVAVLDIPLFLRPGVSAKCTRSSSSRRPAGTNLSGAQTARDEFIGHQGYHRPANAGRGEAQAGRRRGTDRFVA